MLIAFLNPYLKFYIQNGAFLRKCTYLSCDSSYSVNRNDDVTISLKDLTIYEDNDMKDGGSQGLLKDQNGQDLNSDLALNQMQSFSFEAQVIIFIYYLHFEFFSCKRNSFLLLFI